MKNSLAVSLSFVGVLAPSMALSAQQVENPWPAPFAAQTTEALITGDFVVEDQQHALVARGGALYLVLEPALFVGFGEITTPLTTVEGIVTLPMAGPDKFIVSGIGGVYLGSHDTGSTYTFTPLALGWQRLRELRMRPNTSGRFRVMGRSFTDDVVSFLVNTTTGVVSQIESFSLPGSQVLLDADWTDWDGNGIQELALLTDTEFSVVTRAGTPIDQFAMTCVDGDLTPCFVGGVERVAVLRDDGTGWALGTRNSGGGDLPVPLSMVGLPNGLVSPSLHGGDVDNDGDDDLHIFHAGSNHGAMLENAGAGGVWFPGPTITAFVYDIGTGTGSAAANTANAVVADMDYNGTSDVVCCADSIDSVVLTPTVGEESGMDSDVEETERFPVGYSLDYRKVGTSWSIYVSTDSDSGHDEAITLEVYEQPDPNGGNGETALLADPFVPLINWDGSADYEFAINVDSLVDDGRDGTWDDGEHLWFVLRTTNSNGSIHVQIIAIRMASFTVPDTLPAPLGAYLEGKQGDKEPLPLRPIHAGGAVNSPLPRPPVGIF